MRSLRLSFNLPTNNKYHKFIIYLNILFKDIFNSEKASKCIIYSYNNCCNVFIIEFFMITQILKHKHKSINLNHRIKRIQKNSTCQGSHPDPRLYRTNQTALLGLEVLSESPAKQWVSTHGHALLIELSALKMQRKRKRKHLCVKLNTNNRLK